jgi:hypothetical protein
LSPGVNSYIWAFANNPVTNEQRPGIHDAKGSVKMDLFSSTSINAAAGLDYKKTIIVHGLLMAAGWGLCTVAGIFVARYMKAIMGVWWFRAHVAFMLLNVIMTVIAFGKFTDVSISGHSISCLLTTIFLFWIFFVS